MRISCFRNGKKRHSTRLFGHSATPVGTKRVQFPWRRHLHVLQQKTPFAQRSRRRLASAIISRSCAWQVALSNTQHRFASRAFGLSFAQTSPWACGLGLKHPMNAACTPTTRPIALTWSGSGPWCRGIHGCHRRLDGLSMDELERQARPTRVHQIAKVGIISHHNLNAARESLAQGNELLDVVIEFQFCRWKTALESQREKVEVQRNGYAE